jgi:hypothetical protein
MHPRSAVDGTLDPGVWPERSNGLGQSVKSAANGRAEGNVDRRSLRIESFLDTAFDGAALHGRFEQGIQAAGNGGAASSSTEQRRGAGDREQIFRLRDPGCKAAADIGDGFERTFSGRQILDSLPSRGLVLGKAGLGQPLFLLKALLISQQGVTTNLKALRLIFTAGGTGALYLAFDGAELLRHAGRDGQASWLLLTRFGANTEITTLTGAGQGIASGDRSEPRFGLIDTKESRHEIRTGAAQETWTLTRWRQRLVERLDLFQAQFPTGGEGRRPCLRQRRRVQIIDLFQRQFLAGFHAVFRWTIQLFQLIERELTPRGSGK